MLCQNCGDNEASIKYTQIINGVKKQVNLCQECAKNLGIGAFQFNIPIHFSDFFGDFFYDEDTDLLPNFIKQNNNMCRTCGEDYEEFIKTGLLGCPECYNIFEDKLDPILKKLQGSSRHIGRGINKKEEKQNIKIANNNTKNESKTKVTLQERLERLNSQLKEAIKEERYEDAAKIRDEIKSIKD